VVAPRWARGESGWITRSHKEKCNNCEAKHVNEFSTLKDIIIYFDKPKYFI
jgi:hypothetical protein